ncbi:hypothetical protein Undi14_00275 [Undibacterium sp. 14-3-2]|uniref:hypothetical protein n=1 Tax=Undibacterium sp. 14-3-2 TaxID=2800129 RepID=UPI0019030A78|nr:hypothetical protein [Undibacterium sp. 14-3-2]MBK1888448.1 hypothetical protein [Undibacterium sp. 14-3-2]
MPSQLHIVGTGHHYQFGAGMKFGAYECTLEDQAVFLAMLRSLAESVKADAIAEELSEQSLSEVGATASVPQLLARGLGLVHLFCDPNRDERRTLGIFDDNAIRLSGFPSKKPDETEIQRRIDESCRFREEEWLRRLQALPSSQILFVCGANHVNTFQLLAIDAGFKVSVAYADWKA